MSWLSPLGILSLAVLLASAFVDVRNQRVPVEWAVAWASLALILRGQADGFGDFDRGVLSGLVAGLASAAFFGALAWKKRLDASDASLMGALGVAMGFPQVFAAWVFISLAGAAEAVIFSVATRSLKGRRVPYTLAIAAGVLCTFAWDVSSAR